jgi:hypothetical protein
VLSARRENCFLCKGGNSVLHFKDWLWRGVQCYDLVGCATTSAMNAKRGVSLSSQEGRLNLTVGCTIYRPPLSLPIIGCTASSLPFLPLIFEYASCPLAFEWDCKFKCTMMDIKYGGPISFPDHLELQAEVIDNWLASIEALIKQWKQILLCLNNTHLRALLILSRAQ